jgi:MFS family permease
LSGLPSRSVVFIGFATAFSLLGDQVLYSVFPVYFHQLGLVPIQVGLLLSANRWIRLLTNQLAHTVSPRWNQRRLFVAAFALGVCTTATYAATTSFFMLLMARVAWGLSWSFIRHIGVMTIVADTPLHNSGRTMGYYNGISRLGSVAGLFGGALLVDAFGYAPALWVLVVFSLASIPLGLSGIRAERATVSQRCGSSSRERNGYGPYLAIGFSIGVVGPGFVMSTLGVVLQASLSESSQTLAPSAATLTGALLAVRFVLDSAAAPYLGALTDRFGVQRAGASFFLLGGVALFLAGTRPPLLVLGGLVVAFFVAGTALQAGLAGTVSRFGSRAFSRYVTAADIGAAAGPFAGWLALDMAGLSAAGLLMGGVVYVASAVLAHKLQTPSR